MHRRPAGAALVAATWSTSLEAPASQSAPVPVVSTGDDALEGFRRAPERALVAGVAVGLLAVAGATKTPIAPPG